uniref:Uncharacterized protein n=1 Tax=Plectus sambesii TaxID=2011161 RepID=A0A914WPH8_9BILA
MGAFAQLRLLLWKNFLSQIRSPIFTAFEFFVPLILIGASFGLLLGFRYKFETSYDEQIYPAWPVTGGFRDLVQPVSKNVYGTDGTILPLEDFLPGGGPNKCPFLKVIQTSSTSWHLYMSLAYAPVTTSTATIMKYAQAAYSGNHTIDTPLGNITISMTVEVNGNNSEADLVTFLNNQLSDQCNNSYLGGIVFDDDFANNPFNQSISLIKYKIRLTNTERRGDDSD